jgi:hypothetical protein
VFATGAGGARRLRRRTTSARREPALRRHGAPRPAGAAEPRRRRGVEHQGDRVVQEALGLQDRDAAPGKMQAVGDRDDGDLVGRRHDGPEDGGDRPAESDRRVRDARHRRDRRDDEPDREEEDGPDVPPVLAERRVHGLPVEERREEDEEHEVGLELDVRQAGDEAEAEPAEDQDDRIRNADADGERAEEHDGDEERDDDRLVRHRPALQRLRGRKGDASCKTGRKRRPEARKAGVVATPARWHPRC